MTSPFLRRRHGLGGAGDLQELVAVIMEEWQLAWHSYKELQQLQASIDATIQEG